jgi:hypothetical protein
MPVSHMCRVRRGIFIIDVIVALSTPLFNLPQPLPFPSRTLSFRPPSAHMDAPPPSLPLPREGNPPSASMGPAPATPASTTSPLPSACRLAPFPLPTGANAFPSLMASLEAGSEGGEDREGGGTWATRQSAARYDHGSLPSKDSDSFPRLPVSRIPHPQGPKLPLPPSIPPSLHPSLPHTLPRTDEGKEGGREGGREGRVGGRWGDWVDAVMRGPALATGATEPLVRREGGREGGRDGGREGGREGGIWH